MLQIRFLSPFAYSVRQNAAVVLPLSPVAGGASYYSAVPRGREAAHSTPRGRGGRLPTSMGEQAVNFILWEERGEGRKRTQLPERGRQLSIHLSAKDNHIFPL